MPQWEATDADVMSLAATIYGALLDITYTAAITLMSRCPGSHSDLIRAARVVLAHPGYLPSVTQERAADALEIARLRAEIHGLRAQLAATAPQTTFPLAALSGTAPRVGIRVAGD